MGVSMNVKRAIITAASPAEWRLPLQDLVDRHGRDKTALQMIIEEVRDAGIDETCVVICPGREEAYRQAAGPFADQLTLIEQDHPRGYGDALFRAREFVDDDAFLHLVSDHLYLSESDTGCARQLVNVAVTEQCAVSGVQPTREHKLPYFGVVAGTPVRNRGHLYEVGRVIEKPTPTLAEQQLVVPGLRAGHYLCLFGMHVLTPAIMELLDEALSGAGGDDRVSLSPSLSALAARERYLALEVSGSRYNIGEQYGLLMAQLAVALAGDDREQILGELVELLAARR
jgi:UTP--glucose-1-phosphate uridylyltransferase